MMPKLMTLKTGLAGVLLAVAMAVAAVAVPAPRAAEAACPPLRPTCFPIPETAPLLEVKKPDLVPVSIRADDLPDGRMRITVWVRNQGSASAPAGTLTTLEFNSGGSVFGVLIEESAIAPGATVSHVHTITPGGTNVTVTLNVDRWNSVGESNERNNTLVRGFLW